MLINYCKKRGYTHGRFLGDQFRPAAPHYWGLPRDRLNHTSILQGAAGLGCGPPFGGCRDLALPFSPATMPVHEESYSLVPRFSNSTTVRGVDNPVSTAWKDGDGIHSPAIIVG